MSSLNNSCTYTEGSTRGIGSELRLLRTLASIKIPPHVLVSPRTTRENAFSNHLSTSYVLQTPIDTKATPISLQREREK